MIKTNYANKRYVKRTVRRVPKPLKSSTSISLRVEMDEQVFALPGGQTCVFLSTSNPFMNFQTILSGNPAFLFQATNYLKYKITGISVTASPCFTESAAATCFGIYGVPLAYIQQYPTLTGASLTTEIQYSDNNMVVKPNATSSSKYWSYKNNYLIGLGSGVGTWNQTNSIGSQQGMIGCAFPVLGQNNVTGCSISSIRVCLYVVLDQKSR